MSRSSQAGRRRCAALYPLHEEVHVRSNADPVGQPARPGLTRRALWILVAAAVFSLAAATTAYAGPPPTPSPAADSPLAKAQAHSKGATCSYGKSAAATGEVFCQTQG